MLFVRVISFVGLLVSTLYPARWSVGRPSMKPLLTVGKEKAQCSVSSVECRMGESVFALSWSQAWKMGICLAHTAFFHLQFSFCSWGVGADPFKLVHRRHGWCSGKHLGSSLLFVFSVLFVVYHFGHTWPLFPGGKDMPCTPIGYLCLCRLLFFSNYCFVLFCFSCVF